MNKQFLSLLLLTSFVGTMSSAAPVTALSTVVKSTGLMSWAPNFILVGTKSFGTKVSGLMAATGSKVAGLMGRVPANNATVFGLGLAGLGAGAAGLTVASTDAANNVVKSVGNYMGHVQEFGLPLLGAPVRDARIAADLAARSWYGRAASAVAAAKAGVSNGIHAVVASAKLHPKSAIAAGVVGTAAVSYLAYKLYNRSSERSISVNEQQKTTLRSALAEAHALPGGNNVWSPVQPEQLQLVEHFTATTGLPKATVKALNEFVTLDGSCKRINYLLEHCNGRTQPQTVAKYNATKPLRDAVLAKLDTALAA